MASRAAADVRAPPAVRARAAPARSWPFETRVLARGLAGAAPGVVVSAALLFTGDLRSKDAWALFVVVAATAVGFALAQRASVARTFSTIENLIGAVREGDYSFRARYAGGSGPVAAAMRELNLLGATLRARRIDAIEASALLDKVMQAIDVAVFAFDEGGTLRLVNPAGERLVGSARGRLVGGGAESLGLSPLLTGAPVRTFEGRFGEQRGRWELRRAAFRLRGLPHQLVVVADLKRALREEERVAWQRLVRVMGHEINNSLAPIHSIAAQMHQALAKPSRPADWEEDLATGLSIIARRAQSLQRFLGAYAALTRLPPPRLGSVDVSEWVARTAKLETRVPVTVRRGPGASVAADGDQLDQLLINLVRNAAEAAAEVGGAVEISWTVGGGAVEVIVEDDGPGIADTENLFVPFFTTKPAGSGIGLVLCRQIAEAHGGSVTLEPGRAGQGCLARVRLPS
jgi:two-component system, NtrC family, nitrogen regulation sensor histidine kinase NtrY